MLAVEIPGTVDVLADLRAAGVRLVALSNWSAEMFPVALERFDFLAWFAGIVISGEVGVNKSGSSNTSQRFGIEPEEAVFVDDSAANIDTAGDLGFCAIQFTGATALRLALVRLGLLPDVRAGSQWDNQTAGQETGKRN
jgi:2-haloacid dehalogenase